LQALTRMLIVSGVTCASARVSSKFLPFRDNLVERENGLVVQDAAGVLPFREDQLERENGLVVQDAAGVNNPNLPPQYECTPGFSPVCIS
jgi:hypothetical protein